MISKTSFTQANLIERFSALGDSTRFELLKLLSTHKDYCVSELADKVGISTAGVSQQLKILEQAGLLKRNRQGQRICYTIDIENPLNKELINIMENH